MFALDSNTVIHAFKNKGEVRKRLLATSKQEICIPATVLFELEYGTLRSRDPDRRRRELETLIGEVVILPFNAEAARICANIRLALEKRGATIGPFDCMIAATTVMAGAVLVTNNVAEFSRIDGLRLEDWF